MTTPLTELLKKDVFQWNEAATLASSQLKNAVTSQPVLTLPNFELPLKLKQMPQVRA